MELSSPEAHAVITAVDNLDARADQDSISQSPSRRSGVREETSTRALKHVGCYIYTFVSESQCGRRPRTCTYQHEVSEERGEKEAECGKRSPASLTIDYF